MSGSVTLPAALRDALQNFDQVQCNATDLDALAGGPLEPLHGDANLLRYLLALMQPRTCSHARIAVVPAYKAGIGSSLRTYVRVARLLIEHGYAVVPQSWGPWEGHFLQ